MNILYFCNTNKSNVGELGVLKKIMSQQKVFSNAGYTVFFMYYKNNTTCCITNSTGNEIVSFDIGGYKANKRAKVITQEALKFIKNFDCDILYSRYETYSLVLSTFYRELKKSNVKVLLEVPTYPLTQRWTAIKASLICGQYKTAIHKLYNVSINSLGIFKFKYGVDRIVTNNGFDTIWGVPTIKINNGIDVSSLPKHQKRYKSATQVRLLGVATLARWHGYDRVIRGLENYYKQKQEVKVYFDIVGSGLEQESLKKLTSKLALDDYVKFHGVLVGDKLDHQFEKADIGVSVLGAHRSKMKTCDSLKSKEYCGRELPFITGCIENIYSGENFVLHIPDNESPVDISQVVLFAQEYENNTDNNIEIKQFAERKCDWNHTFSNVLNYIKTVKCQSN